METDEKYLEGVNSHWSGLRGKPGTTTAANWHHCHKPGRTGCALKSEVLKLGRRYVYNGVHENCCTCAVRNQA